MPDERPVGEAAEVTKAVSASRPAQVALAPATPATPDSTPLALGAAAAALAAERATTVRADAPPEPPLPGPFDRREPSPSSIHGVPVVAAAAAERPPMGPSTTLDVAGSANPLESAHPGARGLARPVVSQAPDGSRAPEPAPAPAPGHGPAQGHVPAPDRFAAGPGPSAGPQLDGRAGCTAAQLRRFIKSRAYVPLHELRRRFELDGDEDDVSPVDLGSRRLFVGLPDREARLLGELLEAGDVGYELLLDPASPLVVGVFPMRPVPRG